MVQLKSHPKSGWWSLSFLSTPSSDQPCPTSPALWLRYGPPAVGKMLVPYLNNSHFNFKNMSQEPFGINVKKASLAVSTSAGPVYAKEEARDLKKTVLSWSQWEDSLNKWEKMRPQQGLLQWNWWITVDIASLPQLVTPVAVRHAPTPL